MSHQFSVWPWLVRHGGHRLKERAASGLARGALRGGRSCAPRDRPEADRQDDPGEQMKLLRRRPPCSVQGVVQGG